MGAGVAGAASVAVARSFDEQMLGFALADKATAFMEALEASKEARSLP